MPEGMAAKPPRMSITAKQWHAIGLAVAIGLSGGLLLSVPLSRMFNGDGQPALLLPFSNPFAGWAGFAAKEVVVLGRDSAGTNTDAIFTVRVDGGTTVITQIPRDSYIDAEGFGGMKLNGCWREVVLRRWSVSCLG